MRLLLFSFLAASALAGLALWKKALTPGGLALAWCFALVIGLCGGAQGFLCLAATFVFTILAGRISGSVGSAIGTKLHAKTGKRDAVQILCNVATGTAMLLLARLTDFRGFVWGFGGAMSASLADSMASELGVLSRHVPRDILTLRPVTKGLSGGITLLGCGMSLLGAALIAGIFAAWEGLASLIDITAAGFFGALCDSVLGSGLQVKYRCGVCGALTEKPRHCDRPCTPERGLPFVTNDTVNFLNNLIGAGAAVALYALHN